MNSKIQLLEGGPSRLLGHVLSILEDVPVGLLLLDADLRPLWYNAEAAKDCAVWNMGEKQASNLWSTRAFEVPISIVEACRAIGAEFSRFKDSPRMKVLSDRSRGLHDRIKLHVPSKEGESLAYYIQLDYRRPRGDRHNHLSPGAIALLARFTPSEREVAIRVREGIEQPGDRGRRGAESVYDQGTARLHIRKDGSARTDTCGRAF